MQFCIQMGIVTFIFAMVDKHLTKYPDRWNLRGATGGVHLDLRFDRKIQRKSAGDPQQVFAFRVSVPHRRFLCRAGLARGSAAASLPDLLGRRVASKNWRRFWQHMYLPITAAMLWGMVRAAINLIRPRWTRLRAISDIATQVAGLVMVYFLFARCRLGGPRRRSGNPGAGFNPHCRFHKPVHSRLFAD